MTVTFSVLPRPSSSASSQYSIGAELVAAAHDVLGEQKPGRQLAVSAGRAHDDGERRAVDTDLHRLFDGDEILELGWAYRADADQPRFPASRGQASLQL